MILLGERIKQIRKDKQMSRKELAQLLKVSEVTITRYENGQRSPNIQKLNELAKIFDVNINYLTSPTEYDANIVLTETGFFTLDTIQVPSMAKEHLANLIKYSNKDFDFSTLHEEDWNALLNNTLNAINFELFKLKNKKN